MNIEIRKLNLIQSLMKIRDEQLIGTVETLMESVLPNMIVARNKSSQTKAKFPKKKKYVFTLDELVELDKK